MLDMTDRLTVAGPQAAYPALKGLPVPEAVVPDLRGRIVDPAEAELCPERLRKLSLWLRPKVRPKS